MAEVDDVLGQVQPAREGVFYVVSEEFYQGVTENVLAVLLDELFLLS